MFFKKTQPETTTQQKLVQNLLQHSAVKKANQLCKNNLEFYHFLKYWNNTLNHQLESISYKIAHT